MTIDNFLKKMMKIFPETRERLEEHISEYGERLDTIVVEEIIMPEVIELLKKLQVIFDYFEDVSINADDYLNNVFSVTVLEILGNEKNILEIAKRYMGPVTVKLQRKADFALGRKV